MTVSSHVLTLRKKHQELSEEIEEAQRGLATDDLHVTEMKKRKLKIKEEISRLQACLLYTSPSPRDRTRSRMPSSA